MRVDPTRSAYQSMVSRARRANQKTRKVEPLKNTVSVTPSGIKAPETISTTASNTAQTASTGMILRAKKNLPSVTAPRLLELDLQ